MVVALYLPYSISTLAIICFVIHAFFNGQWKRPEGKFWKKHQLALAFALYFAVGLLSLLYSQDLTQGWESLSSMAAFLFIPMAISAYPLQEQKRMLYTGSRWFFIATCAVILYYFMAFMVLNASLTIIEFILPLRLEKLIDLDAYSLRKLGGQFRHPAYFSIYIGLSLIIAIKLATCQRARWKKAILYLSTGPMFLFLFLLQSRMVVIAFFVVIIIFAFTLKRYRRVLLPLVIGLIALSTLIATLAPDNIASRFADFETLEYKKTDTDFNGITVRLAIWEEAWAQIKKQPLLGVGLGDMRQTMLDAYAESGLQYALDRKLEPHNQYITSWLAMGLPGLLCLLWIFYLLIVPGFKSGDFIAYLSPLFLAISAISESVLIRHYGIVILCSLLFLQSLVAMRQKEKQPVKKGEK
ncbi:MAG: O-antigen ligase family protein [Owenweeksia sp.]|nr:O-antigen ligase family protein [Owenweeksia sp.]